MAEYIDRNKIPWAKVDNPKGIFWERIVFESAINNIPPADVIERSEYEYLKKENRELAIKYDNAMNMVINEQENVTRLRGKIDKAIECVNDLDLNDYGDNLYQFQNKVIEIIRSIGE